MRTHRGMTLLSGVLLVLALPLSPGAAQEGSDASPLDRIVAQALRGNPDLRMAEAGILQAEAQVSQARLAAAQQSVTLYHEMAKQREIVDALNKSLKMARAHYEAGRMGEEDVVKARMALLEAEAQTAKSEAATRYLVGRSAGPDGGALPRSLEETLALSLQSNPEICMAEAELTAARARFQQTRLAVIQQVTDLYNQQNLRRRVMEQLRAEYERVQQMQEAAVVSDSEVRRALLALVEAEAEAARAGAALTYALGGAASPAEGASSTGEPAAGAAPTPREKKPEVNPKVEKALEVTLSASFENAPLSEVMKFVQQVTGISIVLAPELEEPDSPRKITLDLRQAPARDVLLAVCDLARITLVHRDYGLLATDRASAPLFRGAATIPPDAVRPPAGEPGQPPTRR